MNSIGSVGSQAGRANKQSIDVYGNSSALELTKEI